MVSSTCTLLQSCARLRSYSLIMNYELGGVSSSEPPWVRWRRRLSTATAEQILQGCKNKPRSRRKETNKPQKQPKKQAGRQEVVDCQRRNVQASAVEASGVTKRYIRLLFFRSAFVFHLLLLGGAPTLSSLWSIRLSVHIQK